MTIDAKTIMLLQYAELHIFRSGSVGKAQRAHHP
jgi:hypothetical protein